MMNTALKPQLHKHIVIGRFFKIIIPLYFKVVIVGKKQINGYSFKEVGNLPIVGNNHFEGYELINPKTNKVLYRKVKSWGIIGDRLGDYNPNLYNTISKFFPQNAL